LRTPTPHLSMEGEVSHAMNVLFPARQFACPVHGSIEASDLETLVIDSSVFQRLRRIKQLGNTHYVFPSATHTRFSHSLGVMHLAGRLFDAFLPSWGDTRTPRAVQEACARLRARVRMAGLLHDVGHGPFSHHFEHMLVANTPHGPARPLRYGEWAAKAKDFALPPSWLREEKRQEFLNDALAHEHYTYGLVNMLEKWLKRAYGKAAEAFDAQGLCSLLDERLAPSPTLVHDETVLSRWLAPKNGDQANERDVNSLHRCLKSILSSDIDADRMDYLQRDSLHSGLRISLDLRHLFASVSLEWSHTSGRFVVLVKPNAVGAIEQILIARKQMFNQVYHHRVTASFDELLKISMHYWMRETGVEAPSTLQAFLSLADEDVLRELTKLTLNADVEHESHERLALKMFLTRTPPVRREEREVPTSQAVQLCSDLLKIHRDLGKQDIVQVNLKEFFRPDRDVIASPKDVLFVDTGRSPVPLRLSSEVLQSSAWREARTRVVANEPLEASAARRELKARLALHVGCVLPTEKEPAAARSQRQQGPAAPKPKPQVSKRRTENPQPGPSTPAQRPARRRRA
jgi:HD superfamily phosphohydrolase